MSPRPKTPIDTAVRRLVGRTAIAVAIVLGCWSCRTTPTLPASPSGAPYELIVTGNHELSRSEVIELVRANLEDFAREDFREAHLDDAAYDLAKQYRTRGFAFVDIRYHVESREGVVVATLEIQEGPRVRLADVVLDGNAFLETDRLRENFRRSTVLRAEPFDRDTVDAELDSMLDEYRDEGFPDAAAEIEYQFSDDRTSVIARVTIREGGQQRVRDVSFAGVEDVSVSILQEAVKGFLDGPFSRAQLFRMRSVILDEYAIRGHPFVELSEDSFVDPLTGLASVLFRVREGPRSKVREVRIEGNEITSADVVRSRLRLAPGDDFDQSKIRESQERLFATGLFETARLDVTRADPAGDAVDVTAKLRERSPLFTDFRLGYGSFEKARFGTTVGTINLFGTGRRVDVGGRVSSKNVRGEATYTDPFVFGSDTQLEVKSFDERRDEPSFSVARVGGTITLSRPLFEFVRGNFGYSFINSNAFDLQPDIPEDEGPRVDVAGFKWGVTREARDNPANPTSGSYLQFEHETSAFALGADVNFYRLTIAGSTYHELRPETVLGAGVRGGIIAPFGATKQIPIQERFFNGGEASVRSFKESELGPRGTDGHPLGGEGSTTASVELRQAIVDPLQIALFVDAGNVSSRAEQFILRGFRFAVGTGIRFVTPVGPLRVDVGLNPNPRSGEDTYAIHFSVGYAF
ncbi:MAG: outer membrane protein assembly factor BamA [Planctomycetes bacterium]|nr:outer membrane protein assembly factor BamA [Planctomycetota bacterium]MBI3847104.1 outer membrane protein assembly factor BamA [Planctomycetota bacterium]